MMIESLAKESPGGRSAWYQPHTVLINMTSYVLLSFVNRQIVVVEERWSPEVSSPSLARTSLATSRQAWRLEQLAETKRSYLKP